MRIRTYYVLQYRERDRYGEIRTHHAAWLTLEAAHNHGIALRAPADSTVWLAEADRPSRAEAAVAQRSAGANVRLYCLLSDLVEESLLRTPTTEET